MTTVNVTTTNNTVTVTENGSSTVVQNPVTSTVTATTTGPQGPTGATGATGPQGPQGATGEFGGATFEYLFSTSTSDADPGTGKLAFNNSTLASATTLFIDDADENGTDIQSFLRTIDDSTSTIKGHFKISVEGDPDEFRLYTISAATEATGYHKVTCAYVSGGGSFSANQALVATFARTGDKGDTGATGPQGPAGANGGTDIVLDTTPQLGGDLDSNGNNINFADGDRLRFGADADLQIFHTGTTSKIRDGGTGNLVIEGNEVYIINVLNGEVMARFTPDGAAELHYDNSKKIETTSTGVEVTGTVVADGVTVGDDERLKLGASDDLQIWHTGSNSVIQDSGTGNLFIQGSSSVKITDTSANEMAVFVDGGAAELYYDAGKKLETTSTGIDVTGLTDTDTLNVSSTSAFASTVTITPSDAQGLVIDSGIQNSDTYQHVVLKGNGPQVIDFRDQGSGVGIRISYRTTPNEWRLEKSESSTYYFIVADRDDGRVDLYYGGSKKFETTSSGVEVTGTVVADGLTLGNDEKIVLGDNGELEIFCGGTNSIIDQVGSGDLIVRTTAPGDDIILRATDDVFIQVAGAENAITCNSNGSVNLYHNNVKKLETTSSGIEITGTVLAPGGTFAADVDTKTDAAIVIEADSAIYTRHNGDYLRNLIEEQSEAIRIGQQNTALLNTIELKPGGAGGKVKLHAGGTTDNVKLETTSTGITVTGTVVADGVDVGDGEKVRFGDGNDLEIYHAGDNASYIRDVGTGNLNIDSTGGNVQIRVSTNEPAIVAKQDGAVDLYHNNSKKFETTSTGVTITGTVVADGFSVGDNEYAYFGDGNDLQIFHNGSASIIRDSGDGDLKLLSNGDQIKLGSSSGANYGLFNNGGSVDLYYDNAKKFETTSTGATITGTCVATEFSGSGASLTGVPKTDTTGITGASAVNNIVTISQADYDAISSPDANTIYYITS